MMMRFYPVVKGTEKKVVVYAVFALVFISAMMVVFQAFEYRHDYRFEWVYA